jgi:ribosomal protein S18 acetylase RimI-like enzyme
MIEFEALSAAHWPQVWAILQGVFRAGETYPQAMDTSEAEARDYWMNPPLASYVAVKDGAVLGVFYIKPNQPTLGAHVCNCGYAVSPSARGQGVGGLMCEWSQVEARRLGYLAMQYNLVVSTNEVAVALWQRHGFEIVGRLTKAFRHKRLGLVDAFVMYKAL